MNDFQNIPKEEMLMVTVSSELSSLKKYAEEVAGSWNGDESGRAEERAGIAGDIMIKIDELNELLEQLEDF